MLLFPLYLHKQLSGFAKPSILLPSRSSSKRYLHTDFEQLLHPSSQLPNREVSSTVI